MKRERNGAGRSPCNCFINSNVVRVKSSLAHSFLVGGCSKFKKRPPRSILKEKCEQDLSRPVGDTFASLSCPHFPDF